MLQGDEKYKLIVIGGSNGGFEAIRSLLAILPSHFSLPIVIVLHQPRNNNGQLCKLLQNYTSIPVCEPEDKERLQPGNIYIAPSNYHLQLEGDARFSYSYCELVNYARPSIDILFETAAAAMGHKLVGVLLTGANSDGAEGLNLIHKQNGLTIVQDPDEARSSYMPEAALKLMKPDHILQSEEIGRLLIQIDNEQQAK